MVRERLSSGLSALECWWGYGKRKFVAHFYFVMVGVRRMQRNFALCVDLPITTTYKVFKLKEIANDEAVRGEPLDS